MQVEVKNLKRTFGPTKAVDDVTFAFESGQIFGFIGPNGSGKTTTMRILATLDEPTAGDAVIDGISVVQQPEHARRRIGFMPDNLPTHRDITVHEYLDFFARAYGLRSPHRRQTVEQIEAFASLHSMRDKTLRALSKGMKQRVSLARALIHDPALLIMDEPGAGLDPRARIELRELLKTLSEQGKAILISSHILTELTEICDGAAIIEQGKLLRAGTMEQLYRNAGQDASQGPMRVVAIRAAGDPAALLKALLETPTVRTAKIAGDGIEAGIHGGDEESSALFAELIRREFKIIEFRQVKQGLEQLFMDVTKGEVQ